MLLRDHILSYHLKSSSHTQGNGIGFELELFCLDNNLRRVVYSSEGSEYTSFRSIFSFLEHQYGFKPIEMSKTIGMENTSFRFTLEPGSQFEYSSNTFYELDMALW